MLPIDKRVFPFLKKLEKNNNREWFAENKTEFKTIESTVKMSVKSLFEAMKVHDDIDQFKIFRIYRDVRFSKNKLPYKTHFAGSFQRRKPELRGGYYLHISPNNESFIAAGFWDPNKEDLLRIRKEFEMDASEMRDIINANSFKSVWGDLEGDELISAPRNFDKEHQNIDLIRKKQYIFTRKFGDMEVLEPDFLEVVNASFKEVKPFFNYMSDVLTTNLNGERII
ncbi:MULTISPECIES: DUF2461 domain-containing protein [Bizionia]|uniref:DUF2461 domain-containing protein n=1 Tax=Bizionia algoritergicola TaxID=291187 RepID=A0A5D0QWQ1_9FLAO|nr:MULTISPECIES: DUF2461 domain-containing protein [Bizionia]OBX24111.1 TIGR02453 family protein [Bizionia sp. APA-3]TYB73620.1 DUF2461 domain-containing protein [Bizionia algoritergicola]